jgi:hypothetical protein
MDQIEVTVDEGAVPSGLYIASITDLGDTVVLSIVNGTPFGSDDVLSTHRPGGSDRLGDRK